MKMIYKDTRYRVSSDGKVYNEHRELSYVNHRGYKRVVLYINKKRVYKYVHILVSELFMNPPDIPYWDQVVRFKDNNKWNCAVSNLYITDKRRFPASRFGWCFVCNAERTHEHIASHIRIDLIDEVLKK